MPHPHYTGNPDAELIAVAERIVAAASARESVVTDDDYNEATGQLLDLVDKLAIMTPRTPAGLRAKARAALASAPRNADGWDPLESTCRHASLSIL